MNRIFTWSEQWRFGANFIPSTAINQLEMWQADTFDPETIDRELGWAAKIGMGIMRVYLHDLLWVQDAEGFFQRMDRSSGRSVNTSIPSYISALLNDAPISILCNDCKSLLSRAKR